jgi:hypothetical protein
VFSRSVVMLISIRGFLNYILKFVNVTYRYNLLGTLIWFYEAFEYFHTYISLVNCIRLLVGSHPGACHPKIGRSELGI